MKKISLKSFIIIVLLFLSDSTFAQERDNFIYYDVYNFDAEKLRNNITMYPDGVMEYQTDTYDGWKNIVIKATFLDKNFIFNPSTTPEYVNLSNDSDFWQTGQIYAGADIDRNIVSITFLEGNGLKGIQILYNDPVLSKSYMFIYKEK
ncbi:hypothetical protein [Reichenbachiella sp. MALMAid0571]|uniref:hypothetical protein n=1 Tax=Reichenbachiella sp. MALMAid0571 TaxID=3143939 RepID=UPI0032DE597D